MDYLASDGERERVALVLRDGASEGRLDPAELEARLEAAYSARTRSELASLVADLPPRAPAPARSALTVRRPAAVGLGHLRFATSFRGRLLSWAAGSAALYGVYGGLAGARSLTNYGFLDFFWPIFPIIGGAVWVWRSRPLPASEDRRRVADVTPA